MKVGASNDITSTGKTKSIAAIRYHVAGRLGLESSLLFCWTKMITIPSRRSTVRNNYPLTAPESAAITLGYSIALPYKICVPSSVNRRVKLSESCQPCRLPILHTSMTVPGASGVDCKACTSLNNHAKC